ncbi:MAG: hypothetical protein ACOC2N_01975 [Spirochaetota bacterium]
MLQGNDPRVGAFFKINRWNQNSLEQLKTELLKAISEDPEIRDATNVGLELETHGQPQVQLIRLIGSVGSEAERQRAARIVAVNTIDEVTVENDLKISD